MVHKTVLYIIDDDDKGFTISYYNGTSTTKCPGGYHSTLVFNCDPNAKWNETDTTNNNITKFITAEPILKDCEVIYSLLRYISSLM